MVFDVSPGFAARLMMPNRPMGAGGVEAGTGAGGMVVLEELGRKLEGYGGFEVAPGRNGRVWVDCSAGGDVGVKVIVAIGRCLNEVDEGCLGVAEQKRLVSRMLRELGLGS
jgi:exosome complex component RRP40